MSVTNLIEENRKKCLMFNEEYDLVFTDIICYIRLNTKESVETEEVLSDLIDIFLENQNKGISVNNVINGDYKEYCKDIVTTLNDGKNPKIIGISDWQIILTTTLLTIIVTNLPSYIIKVVKYHKLMPFSLTLDLLIQTILLPLSTLLILNYMSKNLIFTSSKNKKHDLKGFFLIFLIMLILIGVPVVMHLLKLNILLLNINIFIVFVITILLSIIVFLQIKKII